MGLSGRNSLDISCRYITSSNLLSVENIGLWQSILLKFEYFEYIIRLAKDKLLSIIARIKCYKGNI